MARQAEEWLKTAALPLWWNLGADRRRGGFVEKISAAGAPLENPRRLRVQARQMYVFAEAGRLGWSGPTQEAVDHGLDYVTRHYLREDGLFRTLVGTNGVALDETVELYDQSFVLFALAHAFDALGKPRQVRDLAVRLLSAMNAHMKHPLGGYQDSLPARLPLRSNPHMHLLEAALAWMTADPDPRWLKLANELAGLATTRFGADAGYPIREYFDAEWRPAAGPEGLVCEPGHQYEWAWLLINWATHTGRPIPDVAFAMADWAERHGQDDSRSLVVNAVSPEGAVLDANARLWPQTERLRAILKLATLTSGEPRRTYESTAVNIFRNVERYLDLHPGLWRDVCKPDGTFVEEPAPASSLYHILTAFSEMIHYSRRVETAVPGAGANMSGGIPTPVVKPEAGFLI